MGARLLVGSLAGAACLLVIGPIVIVAVTAFSSAEFFVFPPRGLSLRWFETFFATASLRDAFVRSLELALTAAFASTVLGTMGALYTARRRGVLAVVLQNLFLAPLVFPAVVFGLSLLLFYKAIGGVPVFLGLAIAHTVLGVPFVVRSVGAGLLALDPALEEAGQSLGASPLKTFRLVVLPLIWPSILSGAMFAFVLSFGELNTALFLTGPGVTTLPIEIFSYLQFQGGQLVIAAASAVQLGLIVVMAITMEMIVGPRRLLRQ